MVVCACAIVLGIDFSNHVESSRRRARFWLMSRFWCGIMRWIVVGKYPSMLENLNICDGLFIFSLLVIEVRSRVIRKPRMVAYRAESFK